MGLFFLSQNIEGFASTFYDLLKEINFKDSYFAGLLHNIFNIFITIKLEDIKL